MTSASSDESQETSLGSSLRHVAWLAPSQLILAGLNLLQCMTWSVPHTWHYLIQEQPIGSSKSVMAPALQGCWYPGASSSSTYLKLVRWRRFWEMCPQNLCHLPCEGMEVERAGNLTTGSGRVHSIAVATSPDPWWNFLLVVLVWGRQTLFSLTLQRKEWKEGGVMADWRMCLAGCLPACLLPYPAHHSKLDHQFASSMRWFSIKNNCWEMKGVSKMGTSPIHPRSWPWCIIWNLNTDDTSSIFPHTCT